MLLLRLDARPLLVSQIAALRIWCAAQAGLSRLPHSGLTQVRRSRPAQARLLEARRTESRLLTQARLPRSALQVRRRATQDAALDHHLPADIAGGEGALHETAVARDLLRRNLSLIHI